MAALDGSTVITGPAPLLLFADAGGTRCSATAATETLAWWDLGHRIRYGYGTGQTWPISGADYSKDYGEPLFGRVVEDPGTYSMVYEVINSNGIIEQIPFTVIVTAQPAPTIIEVADGAWPAWTNGGHYALRAGANYSAFGTLPFAGHYDITISKVGEGADPIVGTVQLDSRNPTALATVENPSRNIRLVDIDVAELHCGAMGPQFCAAVRGRVRTYTAAAFSYVYDNNATTETQRANVRMPRGIFLWKTGELNCPSGDQYVMITTLREAVVEGVNIVKNGPTGNHALRNYGRDHVWRHNRLSTTVSSASLIKTQAGNGVVAWTDNEDTIGTVTGTKAFEHRPASRFVFANMVYHTPTSVIPDICVGAGAENNDPGYGHGVSEYIAFSDSVSAENTWQSVAALDTQVNGRAHSTRNVRLANGTYVTQSAGAYEVNVPVEFRGPYRYETVNTRPQFPT